MRQNNIPGPAPAEGRTFTMSKIYTSADQLIGHTPLLELTHIEKEADLKATVLAKLEYFNPAALSRIALPRR